MRRVFDIFTKKRKLFFILMVLLTLGSGYLATGLKPNTDMTVYLPEDSRMKTGLDSLRANFPGLNTDILYVNVMFTDGKGTPDQVDSILAMGGLTGLLSTRQDGDNTLYQFTLSDDAAPKKVVAALRERYEGTGTLVETNANKIMPENIGVILLSGTTIVMAILFVMCSSILEALLFLIAIAMAVLINVGTNVFLPHVSILTTTIAPVLQLVLSMDYSIILMSRYRQERMKKNGDDAVATMSKALYAASRSIFSSSFTTIVGLMALVFMRFRIGMDLGLVLAKGVLCSLVSIYTVLPFLIVKFDKVIERTTKKVPLIPTDRLARFEMKFRIPVTIAFFGLFFATFYLQRKTELSYASIWESEISDAFPPKNPIIMLYRTSEEEKMPLLLEELAQAPEVNSVMSYPTALLSRHSAQEMPSHIKSLLSFAPAGQLPAIDTSLLSARTLGILYYAYTHPVRDEKMNFNEMISTVNQIKESGLLPPEYASMVNFANPGTPSVKSSRVSKDVPEAHGPALAEAEPEVDLPDKPADPDAEGQKNYTVFTYENSTVKLTPEQMSQLLGFNLGQTKTIYKLAGKKKEMTAPEFLHYVHDKILKNPVLSKFISKADAVELKIVMDRADAAVAAGPTVFAQADSLSVAEAPSIPEDPVQTRPEPQKPAVTSKPAVVRPAAPQPAFSDGSDALLEYALSGERYGSARLYRKLKAARIPVSVEQLDLLYLYYGSQHCEPDSTKLSLKELLDFIQSQTAFTSMLDSSSRSMLAGAEEQISSGFSQIRSDRFSAAVFVTDFSLESKRTFDFLGTALDKMDSSLDGDCYIIGESMMYKEMQDGFRKELLLLTIITIVAIFLIVALTFKSFIIPFVLVMTVMTGVFINVYVSGLGGRTMLYLAYLIVQSILMGATIDYAILFTNYYRENRRKMGRSDAVARAYRGSIHTIMTSGLIIILAPFVMYLLMKDPTIVSILGSLTVGSLGTMFLILFALPAVICCLDRLITKNNIKK